MHASTLVSLLLATLACAGLVGCAASARLAAPDGFDLQGHRGARGLLPENTIPAFERALDLGVTTLELDAVVAADGEVVVSHEAWMSAEICAHPDGRPVAPEEAETLLIYTMPYSEVARYDCGRRGNPRFPEQQALPAAKPRLADVIAHAEAHARATGRPLPFYNVETKSQPRWDGLRHPDPDTFARRVVDVLRDGGVLERSTLQSFDVRTLRAARAYAPGLGLVLLVDADAANLPGDTFAQHLDALGFVPQGYSPHFSRVSAALVREAHARGVKVIPWTVNEVDDMARLVALGVDGLITDYPDRFAALRNVTK